MRRHGPLSLTPSQHDAIWDFLFDLPESHAWLSQMTAQIQAGQSATPQHLNRVYRKNALSLRSIYRNPSKDFIALTA